MSRFSYLSLHWRQTSGCVRHAIAAALFTALLGGSALADEAPAAPRPSLIPSPRGDGSVMTPMRRMTNAERAAAAVRLQKRRADAEAARKSGQAAPTVKKAPASDKATGKAKGAPAARPTAARPTAAAPGAGARVAGAALLRLALGQTAPPTIDQFPLKSTPDLFAEGNFANSALPIASCSVSGNDCVKDADCPGYTPPALVGAIFVATGETCTGPVKRGGIRKFVDTLPMFCDVSGKNDLGQCLPIAKPDTTSFGDADYYELAVKEYQAQFHADLPATTRVRGYYQKNAPAADEAGATHYLGPFIIAKTNRPVRVRFVNEVPAGPAGNLFIPTDPTVQGAGAGPDGTTYSQNRANIHLHGGNTPWISDGTQHQWVVPAAEPATTTLRRGETAYDVPDMWFDKTTGALITTPGCQGNQSCADPNAANSVEGQLSLYWTNQQSGRLLFFHDHSYGITRLNVYAGEAAGYLLVNPPDEDALAAAGVPGTLGTTPDVAHVVPLVIQDKTFVPPAPQLAFQDPTWDPTRWGKEGDLWFPHVYTPNQWPGNPDTSAANPMGRWDYGPWFWPPQTSLTTLEGVSRPLEQDCTTMAGQPAGGPPLATRCPTVPNLSAVPESFLDTPVVNGTAYPTLTVDPAAYRFQVLNASNERNWNLSLFVADASGKEVQMVAAAPHSPSTTPRLCTATDPVSPVTGLPIGCWPMTWPVDGRDGGVPDPATAGPAIVQIGSEAGLLPAPAVIPAQPVGYEYNRRSIVVLNVSNKGLFMGPAERADVVIDFSSYAGQTLILYNDAPAPVPAFDSRIDYFTNDTDQTSTGGAPTTHPGYGPNTRTIMQIVVRPNAAAQQAPFSPTGIAQTLADRFRASQPAPLVPEPAFNAAYGQGFGPSYLTIQAPSFTFTPVCAVQVPYACPAGTPQAPITLNVERKAIQELFDVDYGRMNATLGAEVPVTNFLTQTTIPFNDWDPTTDYVSDTKPMIWKITHNGVDTHTIHFHLLNLQIINRVGWDGQIRPPDANEVGWKESIRMHPLEDIYVALQPVRPVLPWPLPDMWRRLDVTRALGTTTQFTGVDVNNNAIPVSNTVQNFGWEYVWHCHLLGHEEADMLRAEVMVTPPETPTNLAIPPFGLGQPAVLTWTDPSRSAMSFRVQRDTDPGFPAPTETTTPAAKPQPTTDTYSDTTVAASTAYYYRVRGEKTLTTPARPGDTFTAVSAWSNVVQVGGAPALTFAPNPVDFGTVAMNTSSAPQTVTVTAAATSGAVALTVSIGGASPADFFQTNNCGAGLTAGATCTVTVTFNPSALGARGATLVVATSDPANPQYNVPLTGTGASGTATVAPTALAFGGQVVGSTSTAQTVTITNTGTLALTVTGVTLGGANAADFAVTQAPNPCGTLAPAAVCTLSVRFTPSTTGARSASLNVATNDPAHPSVAVALSGSGTGAVVSAAPTALAFPNQLVTSPPTASAGQTVTLTNTGSAAVSTLTVTLGGVNAAEFAQTNTCAGGIAANGGTCTVTVTFAPATSGAKVASLTLNGTFGPNALPTTAVGLTGTTVAPLAGANPASLTFPVQAIATTSAPQVVNVTNAGTAPLVVGTITASGDFAQTTTCTSVAPGATCPVSVTFTPTAAGARTGSLTIATSDPVNPTLTVPLSGTGTAMQLSPSAVAFGSQLVNTTSTVHAVTLINVGAAAFSITSIAVAGRNAADYTTTTNCGSSLAAGRSCTINLRFTPAAVGPSTASLVVATSDPASPQSVALSGTGTAPVLSVTPASITSFSSPMNVTSAPQSFTVTNTGTAPLTVTAVSLGGTDPTQFQATNGCTAAVAPGGTCTIAVTFTPTTYGGVLTKTATLTVNPAAPATAQTVTVSGTIVVPTYTLTPTALTFAKQAVRTTSAAQTVTLTNTGTAPLGVRGIALGGTNANDFAQTNTCGTSVAAGATCTIAVTFTPSRVGTRTATLNVRVNAPATSQTVTLTGTGQ